MTSHELVHQLACRLGEDPDPSGPKYAIVLHDLKACMTGSPAFDRLTKGRRSTIRHLLNCPEPVNLDHVRQHFIKEPEAWSHLTVSQLRALLKGAGIDAPKRAKKAIYLNLCAEHAFRISNLN